MQSRRFLDDQSGATVVEYGLMAAIIAVGIIASLQAITPELAANITDPTAWL